MVTLTAKNTGKTITEEEKKLAQVRLTYAWLGHLVVAPAASLFFAGRTSYWKPCAIGTALAIVGIPLAIIDLGFTAFLVAPLAAILLLQNKVKATRRKIGVEFPEDVEDAISEG